jgi:lipid-A-disaccharide synthase-like uncharacterized protein
MSIVNCGKRRECSGIALIASLIIGIIAAFLQITGVITLTPIFSIVAFGIAIVYLAVTLLAASLSQGTTECNGCCTSLNATLIGILGSILFSVILLAITFAATSVIGAIVVGALFFFFSLMITTIACLAKCLASCGN